MIRIAHSRVTVRKEKRAPSGLLKSFEEVTKCVITRGVSQKEIEQYPDNIARVLDIRTWYVREAVKEWRVVRVEHLGLLGFAAE